MKKSVLALAMIAASGTAMAEVKVNDAYVGAELGGNFLTGEESFQGEGTFKASNMVKVGAELGMDLAPGVKGFVGTELRYKVEGIDGDFHEGYYEGGDATDIHRFAVGVDTQAGRTAYGLQEGMADTTDDFGDLSMEHGLKANFETAIDGEATLEHTFATEQVMATASYDFETEAYHVGGQVALPKGLTLGAAYVDGGVYEDGSDTDFTAYTLGATMQVQQIELGAKYAVADHADVDGDAFAVSGAYSLNKQVKVAASYNVEGDDYQGAGFEEDDYFTVGASYALNKNVELVTDYKFASDEDDMLFVRANINF